MDLGINYDQLTPVMGDVRVGVVRYNGNDPSHEAALRDALPRFLGSEGAVHGIAYPSQHIDAVIEAANCGDIYADFLMVALGVCQPVIAGLGTGAHTFGIERDSDNNLKIVPLEHGEDTSLDLDMTKRFREHTRGILYPKGLGLGTHFTRERLLRSAMDNSSWVSGGRDNEYSGDNPPIIGLMNKFGATLGSERDSPVLQLDGFMPNLVRKWWIDVNTQALPSHADNQRLCPNNFVTRWASEDGKQQIALVNTLIRSTFNADRIAWTKIKSNGSLPKGDQLKEVLSSLLVASREEMADRKWGVPKGLLNATGRDRLLHALGGVVPVRLHLNKEPEIADALLQLNAEQRTFGDKPMLSGVTSLKNVPNAQAVFGQPLPEATKVTGIDPVSEARKPMFDLVSEPVQFLNGFSPTRPFGDACNDATYKKALCVA